MQTALDVRKLSCRSYLAEFETKHYFFSGFEQEKNGPFANTCGQTPNAIMRARRTSLSVRHMDLPKALC
jgi:hypothetical protein